jgi:hypothetical protein
VRPTGTAWHSQVGAWASSELERAIEHWRRHFRGAARVKDDVAVTPEDIASSNLILWGDPASNSVLKQIEPKLSIRWSRSSTLSPATTSSRRQATPDCRLSQPTQSSRYVVLNSGFTFRDYAYLNNARQVPMLPTGRLWI